MTIQLTTFLPTYLPAYRSHLYVASPNRRLKGVYQFTGFVKDPIDWFLRSHQFPSGYPIPITTAVLRCLGFIGPSNFIEP